MIILKNNKSNMPKIAFGISREEAIKRAQKLADKKGFLGIKLVSENYSSPTAPGLNYLFQIYEKENPDDLKYPKYVGLPLHIAVDVFSGDTYLTRTL